ncbi:hypothetical protein LUZ60_001436 [Juncus effusus]|nr:hypothetical protein LUZ60_001436 [Juncus effusus]
MGCIISKPPAITITLTPNPPSNSSQFSRPWSDLSYDLLVLILSRLSSVDLIFGASAVCSSWRAAARDPQCWRIVDLSDWDAITARTTDPFAFSKLFERALAFARDSARVEKVFLPSIANGQDLILVSKRLPNLLYLSFPNHDFNRKDVCTAMSNFKSLNGIEAVEDFFDLTISAVSHLKTVSEIKVIDGERKVWRDNKEGFRRFIAFLMCKVFPNLSKLEMPGLCLNAQRLQIVHNKVKNQDISAIKESFRKAESLYYSGPYVEFLSYI